jgi:transcriptional repressor NrdR
LRCPFCSHEDSQVKDSRPTEDGSAIRRRRQCEGCGGRFTTFERSQLRELVVVKSGSRREPFDRGKLERSLATACRKRPVPSERIERLVSSIQRQLETSGDSEVTSAQIGELVMDGLKALDPVAYIRFASVYKDFTEAEDFEQFAGRVRASGREAREQARDLPLPFLSDELPGPGPAKTKRPH